MNQIALTHTTQTGHRIPNHEGGTGKCARLHGHTYTFDVKCAADILDEHGFVVDFGDIKRVLDEWDHRLLLWANDPFRLSSYQAESGWLPVSDEAAEGVLRVAFVPTAENMAIAVAHRLIRDHPSLHFVEVDVHETEKSSARFYCTRHDLESQEATVETAWPGASS